MGSREGQDLLNKLGVWESWERVEAERKGRKWRKTHSSIITF